MATTPPKGKGKAGGKRRVYLALGLVALVIVGYVLYSRSKGTSATGTSPFSTGSPTTPAASDSGGGTGGGSATGTPDDTSAFLSTLAGENQSLINALLSGGGSPQTQSQPVGAPQNPGVAEPPGTSSFAAAVQPAAGVQSSPAVPASVGGFTSYPTINFTPPSPDPASQGTVDLTPAPNIPSQVGGFQSYPEITFTPPASTVDLSPTRSSPANPTGLSGNKKQGVISVH